MLKKLTKVDIEKALLSCGLKSGDTVLVHSDLALLGPTQSSKRSEILGAYYEAFCDVLGEEGTLVVPAYFYEYGRWQYPYDVRCSPVSKELGVFSQYVAAKEEALRSLNPLTALSAIGKNAEYICCGGTTSSYGVDSPWDRLLKINGKMLFLGVDFRAMTFVHYVEYMVGVPHLYSKFSKTPILYEGQELEHKVCSQVRYLDFDIQYGSTVEGPSIYEKAGLVNMANCGTGVIRCVYTSDVFELLKEQLKRDYFYLLKQPPKFIDGKIPTDGAAGAARPYK